MSKEREDFIAWYGSNPEQDEHGNYTGAFTQARWETWQAATAHYQPLLDAKDAEIAELRKKRGPVLHLEKALEHFENASAAQEVIEGILREENTTLKALLEQAREARRLIGFMTNEKIAEAARILDAINAATGEK